MRLPQNPRSRVRTDPHTLRVFGICCVLMSCLLIASTVPLGAETQDKPPLKDCARQSGKTFVSEMKGLGRDIKNSEAVQAVRELGKEIGQVTRDAWKDTLDTREQTLSQLRRKNKELKKQIKRKKKSPEKKS